MTVHFTDTEKRVDLLHEMNRWGSQRRLERVWDVQLSIFVDVSDSVV